MKRRPLMKTMLAAASAPMIIPARLLGQNAPSNRITLGFIGMGGQGMGRNLSTFLQQEDCVALAVCDVMKSRAAKAKKKVDKQYKNNDCATYQDFREVLARQDLDAIVISTPDHWHVPLSMAALRAGKHVLCEKPTLTITEGRELVKEAKKRNAVFQWGIEDRSYIKYHRLAGWARCGAIGKLQSIHVNLPYKEPHPKDDPVPVPDDLDWNMWLGPAPFRPYTPTITNAQNWRNITDFAGGSLTDWGAHLMDTAQVGAKMDTSGPVEVSGTGSIPDPAKYQSNAFVNYNLHYRYSNGVEMFAKDSEVDIKFVGTDGWVQCSKWNGQWSASSDDILRIKEFPGFWPRPEEEHRNFLDCMKSRKPTTYHPEAGHRLSTAMHLGHIALRSGKTVKWDPANEAFTADAKQNKASIVYKRPARDWTQA